MSALKGYERGTLAPLIECARCDKTARLMVENALLAGLECASVPVCLDHAIEICLSLGDTLGAQLISERVSAL